MNIVQIEIKPSKETSLEELASLAQAVNLPPDLIEKYRFDAVALCGHIRNAVHSILLHLSILNYLQDVPPRQHEKASEAFKEKYTLNL